MIVARVNLMLLLLVTGDAFLASGLTLRTFAEDDASSSSLLQIRKEWEAQTVATTSVELKFSESVDIAKGYADALRQSFKQMGNDFKPVTTHRETKCQLILDGARMLFVHPINNEASIILLVVSR